MNVTTSVKGDRATVTPAKGQDPGEVARALLDAADRPRDVRTTTSAPGYGWVVPVAVAEKAGAVDRPAPKKRAPKKTTKRAPEQAPKAGDTPGEVTADS